MPGKHQEVLKMSTKVPWMDEETDLF